MFRIYAGRSGCHWSPTYWIWQVNALSPSTSFHSCEDHQEHIVIVVCPLNSIIEDQLKVLKARRITADVLQLAVYEKEPADNLFGNQQEPSEHVVPDSTKFP